MKSLSRSIALLILGSQLTHSALAATIIPCGTTEPELLLNKFSFNSAVDFVELTVANDGNGGQGAILNNWKLSTLDSTLKILSNISIRTGDTISFKEVGNLTGTTDQLVLTNEQGVIKDAVCWVNASPTTQEKTDFTELGDQWSKDIGSCIVSTGLEKGTVFARSEGPDTNTSTDWKKSTENLPDTETPAQTLPILPTAPIATNEIIVNELFPDPEGSDDNAEWIELKNTSDHEVSLRGWQLDDEEGGSKPYTFKDEIIGAESFIMMSNTVTRLTLNNTKDAVRLINPGGTTTSSYAYQKVETGESWARLRNGTWNLTADTTPGEENSQPKGEENEEATEDKEEKEETAGLAERSIAISEIFPNPTGTDKGGEWIEIHNSTMTDLDLSGWKILNSAGKAFTFPEGTHLAGQGYLILTDQVTKISLKNSGDEVKILDTDENIQDQRTFETAPENVSFAKISTLGLVDTTPSSAASILRWLTATPVARANTEASTQSIVWEWTDIITKGTRNPTYYKIKGIIVKKPDETHTFTIDRNGTTTTIHFDPKKTHLDILKATLTMGANTEITVIEKNGVLLLETYKTIETPATTTPSKAFMTVIMSFCILLASAITGVYLKRDTLFGESIDEAATHGRDQDPSALDDTPADKSPRVPSAW